MRSKCSATRASTCNRLAIPLWAPLGLPQQCTFAPTRRSPFGLSFLFLTWMEGKTTEKNDISLMTLTKTTALCIYAVILASGAGRGRGLWMVSE